MTREELIEHLAYETNLDTARMANLYDRCREALNLRGNIVECGSGHGKSTALLAAVIDKYDPGRQLVVYDTFSGLPPPEPGVDTAGGWTEQMYRDVVGSAKGSVALISKLCKLYGPRADLEVVPGLFADTLKHYGSEPIALLHADADWYYSTKQILEALWPCVVTGGILVVDDYNYWHGCKLATDEYFARFGIAPKWTEVSCAVWGRK